jgi:hypothetical protein
MNWLLFLSQLPVSPSSLRVNVWRKLRSAGALSLQNGVWLLPNQPDRLKIFEDLLALIQSQGASGQIFIITPLNEAIEKDILARFCSDREEEYSEFLEGTLGFLAELDKETRNLKFTFAELEENEQDLQRLAGWLEKIQKRDFTCGEKAQEAIHMLEKCRIAFETFSREVYKKQTFASGQDSEVSVNSLD